MRSPSSGYWTDYLYNAAGNLLPNSSILKSERKNHPVFNALKDVSYEGVHGLTRLAEVGYFIGYNVVALSGIACGMMYGHVEYQNASGEERAGKSVNEYRIEHAKKIHSNSYLQQGAKVAGCVFGGCTVAVSIPLFLAYKGTCLVVGLAETAMVTYEYNKLGESEILKASREFWAATDIVALNKRWHDYFSNYDPQQGFLEVWLRQPFRANDAEWTAQRVANSAKRLGKAYFSVGSEMLNDAGERIKALIPESVIKKMPEWMSV